MGESRELGVKASRQLDTAYDTLWRDTTRDKKYVNRIVLYIVIDLDKAVGSKVCSESNSRPD